MIECESLFSHLRRWLRQLVALWTPTKSDVTEKKLNVMWCQIHLAGKISRGQGHFDIACKFHENCLRMQPLRESKKHLALSHLVDTYIEVHYLRRNEIDQGHVENLLDKGWKMIRPEIERLRIQAPRSKGFRRLLLSLSEIEIRRSQYVAAERLLQEVSGIYAALVEPDIVDRLGHVRAFIALARISPLCEAESRWTDALHLGRKYNPYEEEVFIVALIHLYLCVTRLQQENLEGSKAAFKYAAGICRTNLPQYLIPGAGTYLFDDVQRQIESLAGWTLPRYE